MITEDPYWINILPSNYDHTISESITGKWLYFDDTEKLHSLAFKIDSFVESGAIRSAKIARKIPQFDLFPQKPCVLCVFTSDDPSEKERVKNLLKSQFGITVQAWKSDEQTTADWEDGGKLRIESEINRLSIEIENGNVPNLEHAQTRLINLIKQFEAIKGNINEPHVWYEIHPNIAIAVNKEIEARLPLRSDISSSIAERLLNLEKLFTNISAQLASGNLSNQINISGNVSGSTIIIGNENEVENKKNRNYK